MQENSSLRNLQGNLRLRVLEMYNAANAGHIACSLSCIDLLIAAFLNNKLPDEYFILSKGHAAAALYACLNYTGEMSDEELKTFYKNGTALTAHPAPNQFKSIPLATGSLGHGLPFGAGIAKAAKLKKKDSCTFVLMSDGETNEGTTWEAAHFARHHQLDNLIVMIDKNGLQGFGETKEVLGDTSTPAQWSSLGFDVFETDGHDVNQNIRLIAKLRGENNGMPKAIITQTVKGKGISFMEGKLEWHYLPIPDIQLVQAREEITRNYLS